MNYDWLGLQGKRIAVTGAGSGIGRSVALHAGAAGAQVVLLGRDIKKLAAVKHDIESAGGVAIEIAMDVSDQSSVEAAATEAGTVDVLANCAGKSSPGSLADISLVAWNELLAVNLNGYLLCAQAFGRGMLAQGSGSIVHISSISARNPQGHSGSYSVGKAGILMLSKQIALEWGPQGVRSNSVSPGMVRTPMTEAYYLVGDVAQRRDKAVPLGRVATPDDIAHATLFLASDRAAYVNGTDITVDGGFELTLMSTIPRPGYEGN